MESTADNPQDPDVQATDEGDAPTEEETLEDRERRNNPRDLTIPGTPADPHNHTR